MDRSTEARREALISYSPGTGTDSPHDDGSDAMSNPRLPRKGADVLLNSAADKRKRGRPRKVDDESTLQTPIQRKRGRPKKTVDAIPSDRTIKRKRGRPKKQGLKVTSRTDESRSSAGQAPTLLDDDTQHGEQNATITSPSSWQARHRTPVKQIILFPDGEERGAGEALEEVAESAGESDGPYHDAVDGDPIDNNMDADGQFTDEALDDLDAFDYIDDPQEFLRMIMERHRDLVYVRRQGDDLQIPKSSAATETLVSNCTLFVKDLKAMADASLQPGWEEPEDVTRRVLEIEQDIKEYPLATKRENQYIDLYAWVLPSALEVLCSVVDLRVKAFGGDDGLAAVTEFRLNGIDALTSAIIRLRERAKRNPVPLPTSLDMAQPTDDYIIAPLDRFRSLVAELINKERIRSQRASGTRRTSVQHPRQQRRQQKGEEKQAHPTDWILLHTMRHLAESDPERMEHLRLIGPLPSQRLQMVSGIDTADDSLAKWTVPEHVALMSALQKHTAKNYQNPKFDVYLKIIEEHCGPEGVLRRFSVSDIVCQAMYFKHMLPDSEWTHSIPVW